MPIVEKVNVVCEKRLLFCCTSQIYMNWSASSKPNARVVCVRMLRNQYYGYYVSRMRCSPMSLLSNSEGSGATGLEYKLDCLDGLDMEGWRRGEWLSS
jgi:hypothetical protein